MNLNFGNDKQNNMSSAQNVVVGGGEPLISSLNLNKNETITLTSLDLNKPLTKLALGLGWTTVNGVNMDLDVSAIMLEEVKDAYGNIDYKVLNPAKEVIFYSQTNTGWGISHDGDNRNGHQGYDSKEDDETIGIDLPMIPDKIKKVVFVVTIDKALELQQNFGMVCSAYIRVDDMSTGKPKELCKYMLNENFKFETAVTIAEINRNSRGLWEFKALGQGHFNKTLAHILYEYGVR